MKTTLRKLLHWAIFLAVVGQAVALVFMGQDFLPGRPF